jgi:hypothetical protein
MIRDARKRSGGLSTSLFMGFGLRRRSLQAEPRENALSDDIHWIAA